MEDETTKIKNNLEGERPKRIVPTLFLLEKIIEFEKEIAKDFGWWINFGSHKKVHEGLNKTLSAFYIMWSEVEAGIRTYDEDNTILNKTMTAKDSMMILNKSKIPMHEKKNTVL